MIRAPRPPSWPFLALVALSALAAPGCSPFGTRQRLDESRRMIQTLRAENALIKDQLLSYQDQNRDYSERAVDDARRLAKQDDAIERLERSALAYQRDRDNLEAAFRELRDNLPDAVRAALSTGSSIRAETPPIPPAATPTERLAETPSPRPKPRPERADPTDQEERTIPRGAWSPASRGFANGRGE